MLDRLKQLRQALDNINQADFGKRIATTQGHISDIENGRKVLTERTAKLICSEFNVNEEWLMFGKGEMFIANITDAKAAAMQQLSDVYKLDDIDRKWLDIVLSLPPAERGQLKRLALRLAEAAAELSGDIEAAEEIIADARQVEEEYRTEWGKGLTVQEQAALLRARADALEKGNASSTTYGKVGQDATRKISG